VSDLHVQRITVRARVSDAEMAKRFGTGISESDMVVGLHGDCDVYSPDGKVVCALRRNVLDEAVCEQAYPQLYYLRKYTTDNRGGYTGFGRAGTSTEGGKGAKFLRADGRPSRQTRTVNEAGDIVKVASAVVGYYDRSGGRFPFCRQTAFTANEVERWEQLVPLVKDADRVYREAFPKPYKVQSSFVAGLSKDFVIPGSVFTTLTVNNNVCGTVHCDKGDYKGGLGLISYHRRGSFTGGELVFPRYKVFLDLHDRDVLFFDPHEWHGVNQMRHTDPKQDGQRISVVYYVRQRIDECGTAVEEAARAKAKYGAL